MKESWTKCKNSAGSWLMIGDVGGTQDTGSHQAPRGLWDFDVWGNQETTQVGECTFPGGE